MGFEDLDDLSELDEIPSFDEDLTLPGFDETAGGEGGISPAFKILGVFLLLAVIGIVIVLVFFVLQDDSLTANEKTSTAVADMNALRQTEYFEDQTATQNYFDAQTAEAEINYNNTLTAQAVTRVYIETEVWVQGQTATAEALTATWEAERSAAEVTLAAQQTATAAALTATYAAGHQVAGQVVNPERTPVIAPAIEIRLYKDDGDGKYDPVGRVTTPKPPTPMTPPTIATETEPETAPVPPAAATPEAEATEPETTEPETTEPGATEPDEMAGNIISYGTPVSGTLSSSGDEWFFDGLADEIVNIELEADANDLNLEVRGSDFRAVEGCRISGSGPSISIAQCVLPADGEYIVWVSSFTGADTYTLTVHQVAPGIPDLPPASEDATEDAPEGATEDGGTMGYLPSSDGPHVGGGAVYGVERLAQNQGSPTPPPETTPEPGGDELIEFTFTADGEFQFEEVLEPGTYWLVIDYNALPDNLKPAIPVDEVIYMVIVEEDESIPPIVFPVGAEATLTPTPTRTPTISPTPFVTDTPLPSLTPTRDPLQNADDTATAVMASVLVTLTSTSEPIGLQPPSEGAGEEGAEELDKTGGFAGIGDGSSGLMVLTIAAVGLVAVVFIARRMRTS